MPQLSSAAFSDSYLRKRWWVVFASFCALLVGSGAINVFAFNVFVIPVTRDLNLTRGDFSAALAWYGVFQGAAVLAMGWFIDIFGVRRVHLVGVLLFAVSTFLFAEMTGSLLGIYALYAFAGACGAAQTPVGYSAVLTQWFDRERGLALGVATAGVGCGVILVPGLANALMTNYGWRGAYMGLGVAVFILAFIPNLLFIRDRPDLVRDGKLSAEILPGVSLGGAMRQYRFWVLLVGFTLAVLAINGTITHVVPMLVDRGVPPPQAVQAVQAAGVAIIGGRMISGWFLDRVWGPLVALFFFGLSIIGMGVLASGATGALAVVGAMMCGCGIGAEIDIMGFMVSRYFGMKNYGKIYGLVFAAFNLGTGFGPAISGWTHDAFKSYQPILFVYMGLLAFVCAILLTLGDYVYKAGRSPRLEAEEVAA